MTYSEIAQRIRRAARNGERMHLEQEHVFALLEPRIYAVLAELESEELTAICQGNNDLGNSGLRGARTARNGPSVGMTAPQEPAVESQQGVAISTMVIRQSKRKQHLPSTSPNMAGRKPSTRTAAPA